MPFQALIWVVGHFLKDALTKRSQISVVHENLVTAAEETELGIWKNLDMLLFGAVGSFLKDTFT